jgi:Cd2+/Zn2+-exporting ATPase
MYRTHREINSLVDYAPEVARRLKPDGGTETVPVGAVRVGDLLRVRPDERFPVDGLLRDGQTAADESNLTGEATPVQKSVGDSLYSGTLNLWGIATVETTKPASDSALQRIIHLIHEAQNRRAPSQRFTDRFGTGYTWGVLLATTAVFFLWWQVFGVPPFRAPEGEFSAFYRAMTFLVVASPCALVLSIPSAILAAIASAARQGILFRGGAAIEKLSEVDTVALDKTGTLTTGDLHVVSVESFPEGREQDVAELAFTLESHSNHPIARAVTRYGEAQGLQKREISDFQQISGKGIRAVTETDVCFLGRRELMDEGELGTVLSQIGDPPPEYSEVWILFQGLVGRILLKDEIRTESAAVLKELARMGIESLMLTGDRRGTAEAIGAELGIGRVESGLMPEDKVAVIRELDRSGRKVAMVGDGVNDAPSLAAAYVSVAMGARGSDAALEQAEVVLMNDRIEKFLTAHRLSLRAKRIIRQNITLALGTVVCMMAASILGLIPLTIGVVAHEGSTVVVCLNSLRLLAKNR